MNRIPRRAACLAATAVLSAAAISGCGAGLGADTGTPYDASNGSVVVIGLMDVDDVLIVDDGTLPELSAVLVNSGPTTDALTSVEVSTANRPALPVGGIEALPGQPVTIGPTGTIRVLVNGMTATLGQVVRVTFTFRDAGTRSVDALVVSPADLTAGA